jgi:CBS domain-containing protein
MKVREIMTAAPASCSPQTNLAEAVEMLWNHNCGVLPVVDSQEQVVGLVTDRDICVALGTRNRLPSDVSIGEVASDRLFVCMPDDDLRRALGTMAGAKVRRLPVVDAAGKLEGMLSMDDVIMHIDTGGFKREFGLSTQDIVDTLKRIYTPLARPAVEPKVAAA